MSEFVEECRREWKRLRVPDPVANEMAADLLADLEEAEAEGASAEEVLGSGAFDPRSFAASWAAERGVVQPAPPSETGRPRRRRIPAALAASAVIAIIGAVLVVAASSGGTERVALAAPVGRVVFVAPWRISVHSAPVLPRLRVLRTAGARVFPVQTRGTHGDLRTIGLILLILGVLGFIVSTLYSSPRLSFAKR